VWWLTVYLPWWLTVQLPSNISFWFRYAWWWIQVHPSLALGSALAVFFVAFNAAMIWDIGWRGAATVWAGNAREAARPFRWMAIRLWRREAFDRDWMRRHFPAEVAEEQPSWVYPIWLFDDDDEDGETVVASSIDETSAEEVEESPIVTAVDDDGVVLFFKRYPHLSGWSGRAIAKAADCGPTTVRKWFSGELVVSADWHSILMKIGSAHDGAQTDQQEGAHKDAHQGEHECAPEWIQWLEGVT